MDRLLLSWLVALGLAGCNLAADPEEEVASEIAGAAAGLSLYEDRVVDDNGAAVPGATLLVSPSDHPATLAVLYQDANGLRPLSNPLSSDAEGGYRFYVAAGDYNIEISNLAVTLVNVAIADPSRAHTIVGSDSLPPVKAITSSATTSAGNASLLFERLRLDGTRLYGPWSLHINQGPALRRAELRWLYNVDWNEASQAASNLITTDHAFSLRFTARDNCVGGCADFSLDYAPTAAVGSAPTWRSLLGSRLGGTLISNGPFVVSDGLANSSLIAPRLGWDTYHLPAPAGITSAVWGQPEQGPGYTSIGVGFPAGTVIVPVVGLYNNLGATPATVHAQPGASVFHKGGNGNLPQSLQIGKALVRVQGGVVISPGDTLVSSAVEQGTATVDNSVTAVKRIIGFALEHQGATLAGHVAMVRTAR